MTERNEAENQVEAPDLQELLTEPDPVTVDALSGYIQARLDAAQNDVDTGPDAALTKSHIEALKVLKEQIQARLNVPPAALVKELRVNLSGMSLPVETREALGHVLDKLDAMVEDPQTARSEIADAQADQTTAENDELEAETIAEQVHMATDARSKLEAATDGPRADSKL